MANVVLQEKAIGLLATKTAVDMKTASVKTVLYTVPAGKKCIVTHVVVKEPTASLAGGTSYSFGGTATATGWKSSVDLSTVIASTNAITVTATAITTVLLEAIEFGMYITTGSTLASTATIDVFGFLYDA